MRCQLLFARDERPGTLVLDLVVTGDDTTRRGLPCAVEIMTPGPTLSDQLALASVRRWAATGVIVDVELRRTTIDVRSADGAVATLEPTRIVGLDAVGEAF